MLTLMLRVEWLKNAFWRTALALAPRLADPDDAFARRVLTPAEYRLYMDMDVRDRVHACAVTERLLRLAPDASGELLRAALLHDVGKSGASYSAFERILVFLYAPKNLPAEPRLGGVRGAWQRKRHHPRYGRGMILDAGGGARVAQIVARHHDPRGDAEAALLKAVDERF